MKKGFSGSHTDQTQDANVIQIRGHVFSSNTFRSHKPRDEGSFVLAGEIKNRDEIKACLLPAD